MPNSLVRIHADPAILVKDWFKNQSFTQLAVLVDANTRQQCLPTLGPHLPAHEIIEVPAGERHKNLATCSEIWQYLTDLHFDRHAMLLVLGGGVLGDMGGFCAATYKRGIRFVLMPTTLLSQVDASVGGKLGIDFGNYKNHIGVFQQPAVTLISPAFLKTLPWRELRSGFAEIIKHCLIADRGKWESIRQSSLEEQDWQTLIPHSIRIKEQITTEDPTEKELRKTLNFGHTIGHALETLFLDTEHRLFHGEAIAAGMIAEAFIANRKKLLTADDLQQITSYVREVFGKIPGIYERAEVIRLARQDKKNKGSRILMALPEGLGKCVWDVEVSEGEINDALEFYRAL
ncbi:MAG: 3-dehydroquinate synthase [Flammeovirgaceae bacterium]